MKNVFMDEQSRLLGQNVHDEEEKIFITLDISCGL
jgi:hypothetical protein